MNSKYFVLDALIGTFTINNFLYTNEKFAKRAYTLLNINPKILFKYQQ